MKELMLPGGERPVILLSWIVCLCVAIAPWMTGGREPVAMVITAFALLLGTLLAVRQRLVAPLRPGILTLSYAGLMIWAVCSLMWTANHYSTTLWICQWLLAGLAFRLSYTASARGLAQHMIAFAYLVVAAVFSVAGIGLYLWGDYDRLIGSIYWPNPAAAYIMPALIMSFWWWLRSSGRSNMAWWGSAVVLFGSAFILTGSRAAYLIIGFILVLIALIHPRTEQYWTKNVFAILAPIAMGIALMQLGNYMGHHRQADQTGARLAEVAGGKSQSLSDRFRYAASGFEIWFEHPVLGTGAGTYGDVHPGYQRGPVDAASDAHNVYVQVLAELGLPGAVALAGLLLALIFGLIRGALVTPGSQTPVLLALLALGLHFGLDIDARYPALLALVAVLAGSVWRPWRRLELRSAGWAWPSAALAVVVPVVLLYQSDVSALRAKAAQTDEDYEAAVVLFDAAGRTWVANPDWTSASAINRLVLARLGSGVPGESGDVLDTALADVRWAQQRDPYDGQHWQLEGRLLAQQGTWPQAVRAFSRALQLDPYNHPDYALDLARAQVESGDAVAGQQTARAMLQKYPSQVVANRQADPRLRPTLAELAAFVGTYQWRTGDYQAAKMSAQQAMKFDDTNLMARAVWHLVHTEPPTQ